MAFLTTSATEEVLTGTENKLLSTKYVNWSNLHLSVEYSFIVYALVHAVCQCRSTINFGLINSGMSMAQISQIISKAGADKVSVYLAVAILVHCTEYEERRFSQVPQSLEFGPLKEF